MHSPSVVTIVADGARADALAAAIDAGALPALAALRAEGSAHEITTVFPSVTGPAYAPFLLGRFPGAVGLPGLRWYDRERRSARWPHYTRSYVGSEMRHVDRDLAPHAPTAFELAPRALGAMSVIRRGLAADERIGAGARFILRTAWTHFRGDVAGWLDIDLDIAGRVAHEVRTRAPAFTFAALTGVDKTSHAFGHQSSDTLAALRIVDELVAELRHDAERDGRWDAMHVFVVSDHGHSPVKRHDDLAGAVRARGHGVIAHPWVFGHRRDVAVMVSGNAMAHLYVDLAARERAWWPALAARWEPLVEMLLDRDSVDLVLLPHDASRCEVRARGRGAALVERDGDRVSYRPLTGDPLGFGDDVEASDDESHERSLETDYPDALVQILSLAGSRRAGDVVLSAARDWDFRAYWEPIPHVSSHGALHREHMLVPLIANREAAGVPRRTTDLFATAVDVLGLDAPAELDGRSFVRGAPFASTG